MQKQTIHRAILLTPSRPNLRDYVYQQIVKRLESGELAPGARINLASLARELRLSPTPVREALTQLELEGLVQGARNRGFLVPEHSTRLLVESYPVLGVLEDLAVKSIGSYPKAAVTKLHSAGRALRARLSPSRAYLLDRRWHEALVQPCANRVLLEELHSLRQRTAPAELALMRTPEAPRGLTAEHRAVGHALNQGDTRKACQALRRLWERRSDFVREQEEPGR